MDDIDPEVRDDQARMVRLALGVLVLCVALAFLLCWLLDHYGVFGG